MSPLFQAVASPWLLLLLLPVAAGLVWQWRRSFVSFRPAQMRLMLAVRLLMAACLVAALARPELPLPEKKRLGLAFAVDVSDSIAADRRAEAMKLVERVRALAGPDVETRVVSFAAEPHLGAKAEAVSPAEARQTDIARALRFAADLLPDDEARRIVLISDGRQTLGDARAAARGLGQMGVQVDVPTLPPSHGVDAQLVDLVLPLELRRDTQASATCIVRTAAPGRARVSLSENGTVVESRDQALPAGATPVRFDFQPRSSGLVRYAATVERDGDPLPANDRFERLVEVGGDPRVLVLDEHEDQAIPLEEALRAQGIDAELRSSDALPKSIEELSGFDAVVLSEVSPTSIDRLGQSILESYVRDLGGGLVVVAGPTGLRGEDASPFGRMLPVELNGGSERQVPPVALVLVIDRSGSMAGQKLEYAKNAALATVDALPNTAKLGVIAFDANYSWVVPLGPVTDKKAIHQEIASLASGGGTRFYPSLKEAYFTLASTDAASRHVVLMTDGLSTDGDDFDALVQKMRGNAVTLSTVAISREADQKLLSHLAQVGQGRYHLTDNASDVPRIFVDEAKTALSNALTERAFAPKLKESGQEVLGLDFSSAPPLRGYVITKAKPTAETLLGAARQDPLLVRWRYGIGRVEVFTSDAKARWAQAWLGWGGFNRLWGQIVHSAIRGRPRDDLVTRLERRQEQVVVTIDAVGVRSGLEDLSVEALVIDAAHVEHRLAMRTVGPGLFEGALQLAPGGSILARPIVVSGNRSVAGRIAILDEPYAAEFAGSDDDEALLSSIAAESGGARGASPESMAQLSSARSPRRRRPAWPYLAGLALLLLVPDLLLKRIRWGRSSS